MSLDLFDEMLALLHRFYPPEALAQPKPLFPLEEVIFPTVLPALLGEGARIVPTRARVREGEAMTAEEIETIIAAKLHASAKRVPQQPGNRARQIVLRHLPGEAVARPYGGVERL
jgi:hypothetical protein